LNKFSFKFTMTEHNLKKEFVIQALDQDYLKGELIKILRDIKREYGSVIIGQASLVQCEGTPLLIRQININDILNCI
jgi:hypothetical protein